MPNRIIKESICTSEKIDQLGAEAECFFYRLVVNCDDFGLLDARPAILKSKCYPLKSVDSKRIQALLISLCEVGLVELYEVNGRQYLHINKWDKHQQIRAKRAKYPMPSEGVSSNGNHLQSTDSKCPRNPIQSNPNPIQSESNLSADAEAVLVFDHWRERMNHQNAKLDDKRKKLIQKAIRLGYTTSDLIAAIDGCAKSPFHMGDNDRKAIYDGLDLILRDASKIDGFIKTNNQPVQAGGNHANTANTTGRPAKPAEVVTDYLYGAGSGPNGAGKEINSRGLQEAAGIQGPQVYEHVPDGGRDQGSGNPLGSGDHREQADPADARYRDAQGGYQKRVLP